jgi:membrane protease YdiL (CAAX protease family)
VVLGAPALAWVLLRRGKSGDPLPPRATPDRPWGGLWAAGLTAVYFAFTIAGMILAVAIVAVRQGGKISIEDIPFGVILLVDMASKAAAVGVLLLALRVRGEKAGLGGAGPAPGRAFAGGALAGLACVPVLCAVGAAQGWLYERMGWKFQAQDLVKNAAQGSVGSFALVTLFAVVAAPIFEELLFRGFLYSGLRRRLRPVGAALFTAAFFSAFHLEIDVLLVLFVLGLWLAWIRERTGGLMAPIAAHACYNAYQMAGVWLARPGG